MKPPGLKPEFIDGVRNFIEHTMTLDIFKINRLVRVMVHLYRNGFKPRYFVWIDHGKSDGLDGIFYNSMPVDVYNMVAPHGQIRIEQVRVEHDRVHEMINDAFGVQGGMEPEQYFDEAPNEEARRFYDQLEESSRPLCEGSPHSALSVAVRLMNIKSDWNGEKSMIMKAILILYFHRYQFLIKMMDHRLWMYNMHYETGAGLKPEFIDGVRNFIEHTMTLDIFKINRLVRCPCSACKCLNFF
ncbi:hypothetical protein H5410_051680 [Solanum commersonii]|uniref:Transposase-associated domain-containing protein n=1 Tax=Solanum commersonii TaxID=4109 RepID=A0A9J5X0S9_SOLCO|nr:hypothetical protein H5410_051680 [Solanum commersonii]